MNDDFRQDAETHRDHIAAYLNEPAFVIRKRYLALTDNRLCAAALLDLFVTSSFWQRDGFRAYTLSELRDKLFKLFSLPEISAALNLLLTRGYILLAPEPLVRGSEKYSKDPMLRVVYFHDTHYYIYKRQVIDEKQVQPYTLLIDYEKIALYSEAYEQIACPRYLEIENKRLKKTYKTEASRVKLHQARAAEADLPASLTLHQWITTLNYFNWQCAYCHGPYHVIEHVLPIAHAGGTTWSNCVPACRSCNTKKGTNHPSQVSNMPALQWVQQLLTMIAALEKEIERQHQEAERETHTHTMLSLDALQDLDLLDRWTVQSYRFDRQHRSNILSIRSIRLYGLLSTILLLILIAFDIFLAPSFFKEGNWQVLLIGIGSQFISLCLIIQALLSFHPKHRQKTEALYAESLKEDEQAIQRFTQTIHERNTRLALRLTSPSSPNSINLVDSQTTHRLSDSKRK